MPTPPVPYFLGARGKIGNRVYRLFRGHTYARAFTYAFPTETDRQDDIHTALSYCWYYYQNTVKSRATWPAWVAGWADYAAWPSLWSQAWLTWARPYQFKTPSYQQVVRAIQKTTADDPRTGILFFVGEYSGTWYVTLRQHPSVDPSGFPRLLTLLTGPSPDSLQPFQTIYVWPYIATFNTYYFSPPPPSHTCWQVLEWNSPISGIFTARPRGLA